MNKKIQIKICDYGYSGEGVGRSQTKVCFVPYTIKDEVVEGEVLKETSSFLKLKLCKVLSSSCKRISPPCPYFANCGGCAFQHLSYIDGLDIKKEMLAKQLAKAGFKNEIKICPSQEVYGYRNKIKLFCNSKGLALCQSQSNKLVNIDKCLLVGDKINKAVFDINNFISAKNLQKDIVNVYIRCQDQEIIVWFKFEKSVKVDFSGLQIMLGAKSGIFVSVGQEKPIHVSGKQKLQTKEFDLDCEFAVNAFHQVNDNVAQKLYQEVLDNICGDQVINAYSGAGVLSGIIAKSGKKVFGVELGLSEHEDAEKLKQNNNLKTLFNIHGDCAVIIPQILTKDIKTIVIDPPRAGLDKSVAQVLNLSCVERIIYISCDSSTLTRDLQRMGNYKISSVKMFDMFPQTSSIETLCILDRLK